MNYAVNGFVVEPTPAAVAAAIGHVTGDQLLAERLGAGHLGGAHLSLRL